MRKASISTPLPPGYRLVQVKTTYLEMMRRPEAEPIAVPEGCEVKQWEKPEVDEYKELFSAVGGEWGWSGRLILKEEELKAILHAPTTEVHRLRCSGKTAGFVELDRSKAGPEGRPAPLRRGPRRGGQVEIAYFGLVPAFIGRGLGKFFLDWAVRRAWRNGTERVWLHTCQYDHAGALAVYLKAGFSVYDETMEAQPYQEGFIRRFPISSG